MPLVFLQSIVVALGVSHEISTLTTPHTGTCRNHHSASTTFHLCCFAFRAIGSYCSYCQHGRVPLRCPSISWYRDSTSALYLQNRPHRCLARQAVGCACRRYR